MEPTVLVATFSTTLDPSSATNVKNYILVSPTGNKITIRSAVDDPSTDTVTLRPSERIFVVSFGARHLVAGVTRRMPSATSSAMSGEAISTSPPRVSRALRLVNLAGAGVQPLEVILPGGKIERRRNLAAAVGVQCILTTRVAQGVRTFPWVSLERRPSDPVSFSRTQSFP